MASKRDIVEQLRRDELQAAVETYGLDVRDRRVNEDMVDAVVRAKRVKIADVLATMSRDRLKEVCISLELDDSGREKSLLIDRICGDAAPPESIERPGSGSDAAAVLGRLFGQSLQLSTVSEAWPAQGTLRVL